MRSEFRPEDAKRFYDRFGRLQDTQFYERAAIRRLIARADFEHASAIFEVGCGTGRLAENLFQKHLAQDARYTAVDISTTMIEIATRRLARWDGRVALQQSNGAEKLPYRDETFDRFIATYVLDLLPSGDISNVISEAHRLLRPGGRLCVVSSIEGTDIISRAISSAWRHLYAINPGVVGGCRPLRVSAILDQSAWCIEYNETVCSWGICSEIVIAKPAPRAN